MGIKYKQLHDKEWFYNKYWIEEKKLREIAEDLGCTREQVSNQRKKLGIPPRSHSDAQKGVVRTGKWASVYNAEWLKEQYMHQRLSIAKIAEQVGCSFETIRRALIKANIPRRTDTEKNIGRNRRYPELHNEEWLREKYIGENLSQGQIERLLGCSGGNVGIALRSFGIPIRKEYNKREKNGNFKYPKAYDKDFLWQRYVVERKTGDEIAKELGCHNTIVFRGLRENRIPRRTHKEWMDEDYKRKGADRARELWKDKDYVKNVFDGLNAKPNKFEQRIYRIIQNAFLNEWAYNGDFSEGIMIGGKIPDFINVNGRKQVIECFGDPYHDGTFNSSWKRTEFGTKAIYNQVGFSCLVLWFSECEKKTDEQIAEEVKQFMEREK